MILCIVVNIFKKFGAGLLRAKLMLNRSESHIKEPRKKVEIRLKQYEDQLTEQINNLELILEKDDLSESTLIVGKELYENAKEFMELNYIKSSRQRIANMITSLLDYDDFSIWVKDQTKNYVEKIICFNNTTREE